mmetsp:Transcript_23281/g.69320  ORF Transcript_23281/g.69320 Transcript_23281/m.69320 type:complete len:287 (-) Transcript_23281:156-1016(-)
MAQDSATRFWRTRQWGPQLARVTSNMVSMDLVQEPQLRYTTRRSSMSMLGLRRKVSNISLTTMETTAITESSSIMDQRRIFTLDLMDFTMSTRGSNMEETCRTRMSRSSRATRASLSTVGLRTSVMLGILPRIQKPITTRSNMFHTADPCVTKCFLSTSSFTTSSNKKTPPKTSSTVEKTLSAFVPKTIIGAGSRRCISCQVLLPSYCLSRAMTMELRMIRPQKKPSKVVSVTARSAAVGTSRSASANTAEARARGSRVKSFVGETVMPSPGSFPPSRRSSSSSSF